MPNPDIYVGVTYMWSYLCWCCLNVFFVWVFCIYSTICYENWVWLCWWEGFEHAALSLQWVALLLLIIKAFPPRWTLPKLGGHIAATETLRPILFDSALSLFYLSQRWYQQTGLLFKTQILKKKIFLSPKMNNHMPCFPCFCKSLAHKGGDW